jgi:hypothetical protein
MTANVVNLDREDFIMNGFEHGLGVPRGSQLGQWTAGTLRSLATIAVSALAVWIAVSAINETGLLQRSAPAQPHSPAGSSPFPQVAYG